MTEGRVFVEVTGPLEGNREIGSLPGRIAEELDARLEDVRRAIRSGAAAVAEALVDLGEPPGWRIDEVAASFGITLTAEAGVLISRASAGATFEVTVTWAQA